MGRNGYCHSESRFAMTPFTSLSRTRELKVHQRSYLMGRMSMPKVPAKATATLNLSHR